MSLCVLNVKWHLPLFLFDPVRFVILFEVFLLFKGSAFHRLLCCLLNTCLQTIYNKNFMWRHTIWKFNVGSNHLYNLFNSGNWIRIGSLFVACLVSSVSPQAMLTKFYKNTFSLTTFFHFFLKSYETKLFANYVWQF